MNPFQLMQMLQSANNPTAMLQQLVGNNPMLARAMQMGQGKDAQQLQQTVRNLARQRGMSDEELGRFVGQFGLHL